MLSCAFRGKVMNGTRANASSANSSFSILLKTTILFPTSKPFHSNTKSKKATDILHTARPWFCLDKLRRKASLSGSQTAEGQQKHKKSRVFLPSEPSAPCDMPPSAQVYSHTGTVSPIMRRIIPNTAAGEARCLRSLGNNYWGVLCVPPCPNYLSFIACHSKWERKRRRGKKKPLQGGCVIIRGGTHWKFRVFLLLEKIGSVVWKGSSICMKFQAHL